MLLATQKGRSAKEPGFPPSIWSNMSTASTTCSGWKNDVPIGLEVPMVTA